LPGPRQHKPDADPAADQRVRGGRIVANFGFLTVGKLLGDGATFLFIVAVSRLFGQEGIGLYSMAMAWTGFLAVLAEFGLYNLSIKRMSRRDEGLGAYLGEVLSLRLLLVGVALVALAIALPLVPASVEAKRVLGIIGTYQILYTLATGLYAVPVSREEMHITSFLEFSLKLAIAVTALIVLTLGGSLAAALLAYPVLTAVQVVALFVFISRRYEPPRLALRPGRLAATLREAVPYGLSRLLLMVSTRTDVAALSVLLGVAAAGVYNVAYRVVFLLLFVPHYASLALFPVASRLFGGDRDKLRELYHRSLGLMVLGGLPATVGLWLVAPDLIERVFGSEFDESAGLLRILAWLLLLSCLKSVMGVFLTACDRQVERAKGQWTGAWVNLAATFLLIPLVGIKGAAIAVLLSETVLTTSFALRLRDLFGLPRAGSKLAVAVLGTLGFCLPLSLGPELPFALVIPVAVVIYVAVLAAFPRIRRDEGRFIGELWAAQWANMAGNARRNRGPSDQ